MLVDQPYQRNVGYVVAEYFDESTGINNQLPIGTFFIVEQHVGNNNQLGVVHYAVTCRHVLEQVRQDHHYGPISLRLNNRYLLAEDVPCDISNWIVSDTTDLAVAELELSPKFLFWAYPRTRYWILQRRRLWQIRLRATAQP